MKKVLKSEDIGLSDILLLMLGGLFLICDDFNHCYLEMMNELMVDDG
jgi:hypothetical protein